MRGIILKDSVKLFGFRDGFKFWFRWSFVDPTQTFWWLNVSHKSYCLEHGWVCKNSLRNPEGCNAKKLTTKKQILKHWEKTTKEMNHIEKGKKGMCVYCDKRKGSINIPNPNFEKINQWRVCLICDEVIKTQQDLGMGALLSERPMGREIGNKMVREAHEKLNRIEEEIEEPILSVEIRRKS